MEWIIILAIVVYFGIRYIRNANNKRETLFESENDGHSNVRDPYECIDGFKNFQLKGIAYRNLPQSEIRDFYGTAVAEENNPYDEFAVAIYNDKGYHVGYAPGGYYSLHEYIRKQGGKVRAFGYIWEDEEGSLIGRVNIEFNPNHFHDDTPEEERIYETPNLKKYGMVITEKAVQGKFFGYAKAVSPFNFSIYDNNSNLIGTVSDEEYLYNTVKIFDGGKVECWGIVGKVEDEYAYHYVYIPGRCGKKKIANAKKKFEDE